MRFTTICLLLILFFFGGVFYGTIEKTDQHIASHDVTEDESNVIEVTAQVDDTEVADPFIEYEQAPIESKEHFTNKSATLLESVVSKFYNFIVSMLYSISRLFF